MEKISIIQSRLVAAVRSLSPSFAIGCERILQDIMIFTNHERMNDNDKGDGEDRPRGLIVVRDNGNGYSLPSSPWFTRGIMVPTQGKWHSVMPFSTFSTKRFSSSAPDNKKEKVIQKEKVMRFQLLRQGISAMLSVGGFLQSSLLSHYMNPRTNTYEKTKESIQLFLKTSGLDQEFAQAFNSNMGVNLALLARVQMERWKARFQPEVPQPLEVQEDALFWTEAKRYMRYATAVYGRAMIHAAQVEARGNFDFETVGKSAVDTVSKHIGVPTEDIHLLDIDYKYKGNSNHLRHFVAVDHKHEKVVLTIRGTFSPDEVMVDICAFSKPFCGGEAHSEMASMTERVWDKVGPTIQKLLEEHSTYEFIVTGHSLGAGTACLLTIMLQSKQLVHAPIRCFAFASPPVFAPLEACPNLDSITNFIHEHDVAPFLSVFSVRQLLSQLKIVEDYAYGSQKMSSLERLQVAVGKLPPPPGLMEHFQQWRPHSETVQGAPCLRIPAGKTIWLHHTSSGGHKFEWECITPQDMADHFSELRIHPEMLSDHFAPAYEFAFEQLDVPTTDMVVAEESSR
eukprot:scaffold338_cov116-Cylindrotheca_fusiformis.AAC.14